MNDEDKILVKELGLDQLTEEAQAQQVAKFYQTLRMRVAMAIEGLLTSEQLQEFGKLSDSGDEAALNDWFRSAVPNYEQVVAEQTDALKRDIRQTAGTITSAINEAN